MSNTDTNQASELFELCKEVYKRFPKWNDTEQYLWLDDSHHATHPEWDTIETATHDMSGKGTPLYTSDYLLEKLPEEVKKRVLVVTNGDRPHAGYAERDNYGNYTLDEYYWKNAQYSNEVLKALLKLTIALSEAGELK